MLTDEQRIDRSKFESPRTGGFASLQPEDAEYAAEVCRQQDPIVRCRVQLRLEPEHYVTAKRAPVADQPVSDAMDESKTRRVPVFEDDQPPDYDAPPPPEDVPQSA